MPETKPAPAVSVPTWVHYRYPDTVADDWRPVGQGWAHKTAVIADEVTIAADALIAAGVTIAENVTIAAGVTIAYGAAIAARVDIAEHVKIGPKAKIDHGATIGPRARIAERAAIGPGARVDPMVTIAKGTMIVAGVTIAANPLVILDSRHPVHAAAPDRIGIGCIVLPVATWRSDVDQIGHDNDYSPAAIAEYRRHVEYVADWLARNQDKIRYADATTAEENQPHA